MNKVITYGTFDTFHYGHLCLLKAARKLGDHLTVAVSTDEFNSIKGKKCVFDFEQRQQWVNSIKYVDVVIAEEDWEQKINDVVKHNISTFTIGDDWKGVFDFLQDYCEVIYLPRTVGISSTDIKKLL